MRLQRLFTLVALVKQPLHILQNGPIGQRVIGEVTGGTFIGERLHGDVVPPGADWCLYDATGVGQIDVRLTLKTDDQQIIYMQYRGRIKMSQDVNALLANGGESQFGDAYFMVQPLFETDADNYLWLNQVVSVAEGRIIPGGVEYEVFECLHHHE